MLSQLTGRHSWSRHDAGLAPRTEHLAFRFAIYAWHNVLGHLAPPFLPIASGNQMRRAYARADSHSNPVAAIWLRWPVGNRAIALAANFNGRVSGQVQRPHRVWLHLRRKPGR